MRSTGKISQHDHRGQTLKLLESPRDSLQNKVLLRELLAVDAVEIIKKCVFAREARKNVES